MPLGGDFYDALVLEGCLYVSLADVSGKGVSAAIVAATLQGIIHAHLLSGQSLANIGRPLNEFLCTRNVGKYATLVILKVYPNGQVDYLNCGHLKLILVFGQEIRRLEDSNMVVGLVASASYACSNCHMRPGERLLLVTDGLTEAEDSAGNQLGDSGMDAALTLEDVDEILAFVHQFQKPNLSQDDCTLFQVRYRTPPQRASAEA